MWRRGADEGEQFAELLGLMQAAMERNEPHTVALLGKRMDEMMSKGDRRSIRNLRLVACSLPVVTGFLLEWPEHYWYVRVVLPLSVWTFSTFRLGQLYARAQGRLKRQSPPWDAILSVPEDSIRMGLAIYQEKEDDGDA